MITVAVEKTDGGIEMLQFADWQAFGEWAKQHHDDYCRVTAKGNGNGNTNQADT